MARSTRYTFSEVVIHGEKSSKCGCGKRRTRRKKFWQTLNPFNTNAEGNPKSHDEILVELRENLDAWKQEPIECAKCPKG